LHSQKAKLIENAKDVFDELGLITREARYSNRKLLEGNQKIIYELLRAGGAISFDAILAETKLTAKALIAELTLLEIEEYIYKDIDLKYSAII
jgi:predicted Rossmann fold nucleotide-binding protein DprA/Smf involved in DNA uptake